VVVEAHQLVLQVWVLLAGLEVVVVNYQPLVLLAHQVKAMLEVVVTNKVLNTHQVVAVVQELLD